jgi:hypothetical protein
VVAGKQAVLVLVVRVAAVAVDLIVAAVLLGLWVEQVTADDSGGPDSGWSLPFVPDDPGWSLLVLLIAGATLTVAAARVKRWAERREERRREEEAAAARRTAETRAAEEVFAAARAAYLTELRIAYGNIHLEMFAPEGRALRPVPLRAAFVPQWVREKLPAMEMSKGLQRRLVETGAVDPTELPAEVGHPGLRHASSTAREQPPLPVLTVVGEVSQRLLVLLGNPGSGKSALARYLALTLAAEDEVPATHAELRALDGMLPIVVELGKYADPRWRAGTFLDLIDHQHHTEGVGMPKAMVQEYLLRGGPAVVIFDGLDEVTNSVVHQSVTREIAAFSRRHPQVRVIVTSRPTGYRHSVLEAAGFAHYELDDLNREQIGEFVTGWYALTCRDDPTEAQRRRQRLLTAVDESASLRELAGNPMLLTILSLVGGQGDLPRDRSSAYARAAELLVAHWDVERHVRKASGLVREIQWHDKLVMLQRAARLIQGNRSGLGGNRVAGADLVRAFEGFLRDQHQLTAKQAMRAAQALLSDFHERSFVFSYLGDDEYGFVHQAFLEYFTATDIVARLRAGKLTVDDLIAQICRPHWAEPAWHEVLVLVSGMVEAAAAGRIVDFLVDADPLWFAAGDRVPRHVLLAVRCLGENRSTGELTGQGARLVQAVISVCEHARYNDTRSSPALESLHAVVLPVWTTVGVHWPGRHLFLSWFLVRARWMTDTRAVPSFPGALPVGAVATLLAGAVFAGDPSVRTVLVADAVHAVDPLLRLAAIHALAAGWPEDRHTLALVRARAATDPDADVRQAALQTMSAGWPADPATQVLLRERAAFDPDGEVRQAAVQLLVAGWRDSPEVLTLALERVVNDDHGSVRLAAVRGLTSLDAEHATVLPVVRVLAKGDPDPQVRRAALQGLAAIGRRDDGNLHDLLRGRAVEDSHPAVRRAAVQVIAGRWRDDPLTLAVVRERATADDDWLVRQAAVVAMAGGWGQAPGTLSLVRERICEDEHPAVRRTAIEALAARWATDAATLSLVRERVRDDEDWTVRRAALQALATGWRDDPRTLPLVGERAAADTVAAVRQAAIQVLVTAWPEAAATASALRERATTDTDEDVRRVAVQVLAGMAAQEQDVLALLRERATGDSGWTVRRAAVRGLAAHARDDPPTVACVRERATADPDPAVRRGAVHVLTAGWAADPATVALVRTITTADHDWAVRRSSLQLLVAGWQADDGTHRSVRDRATGDPHPGVRQAALQLLVAGWREARDTLRLTCQHAATDADWAVRRAALRALAAGWPDSPAGEAIVRDRAVLDPDSDVRRAALQALATGWGNSPATEALIADRAGADAHVEVRRAALRLLVSGWRNSPPTLNVAHERATHDEDPAVRRTARQLLRTAWPNHPIVVGLRDVGSTDGAVAGEI